MTTWRQINVELTSNANRACQQNDICRGQNLDIKLTSLLRQFDFHFWPISRYNFDINVWCHVKL